jgi:hypothetical protein
MVVLKAAAGHLREGLTLLLPPVSVRVASTLTKLLLLALHTWLAMWLHGAKANQGQKTV